MLTHQQTGLPASSASVAGALVQRDSGGGISVADVNSSTMVSAPEVRVANFPNLPTPTDAPSISTVPYTNNDGSAPLTGIGGPLYICFVYSDGNGHFSLPGPTSEVPLDGDGDSYNDVDYVRVAIPSSLPPGVADIWLCGIDGLGDTYSYGSVLSLLGGQYALDNPFGNGPFPAATTVSTINADPTTGALIVPIGFTFGNSTTGVSLTFDPIAGALTFNNAGGQSFAIQSAPGQDASFSDGTNAVYFDPSYGMAFQCAAFSVRSSSLGFFNVTPVGQQTGSIVNGLIACGLFDSGASLFSSTTSAGNELRATLYDAGMTTNPSGVPGTLDMQGGNITTGNATIGNLSVTNWGSTISFTPGAAANITWGNRSAVSSNLTITGQGNTGIGTCGNVTLKGGGTYGATISAGGSTGSYTNAGVNGNITLTPGWSQYNNATVGSIFLQGNGVNHVTVGAIYQGGLTLGFFGASPVIQATATTDIKTALVNYGLLVTGTAPLNLGTGALTCGNISSGNCTHTDGTNIIVGSTTGTQIGTATTQKLAFYGASPVVQSSGTTDIKTALVNYGLLAAGTAPLNLGTGALTSGSQTISDGYNVVVGTTTGTQFGTATNQKLGFYGKTPVVQPSGAAQAAVTLWDTVNAIGSLSISATYIQSEHTALKNDCESLAGDVRNIAALVNTLQAALVTLGAIKGSA